MSGLAKPMIVAAALLAATPLLAQTPPPGTPMGNSITPAPGTTSDPTQKATAPSAGDVHETPPPMQTTAPATPNTTTAPDEPKTDSKPRSTTKPK